MDSSSASSLTLKSTKKFTIFDMNSVTVTKATIPLPIFSEYVHNALNEYHKYVPDDMDWDIYEACAISIKEQRELKPENLSGVPVLTYGEINFDCFAKVLYDLKVQYGLSGGGCFYDLGSGTGKVVLAAALLHDFKYCRGVELLRGLHEVAVGYQDEWQKVRSSPVVEYTLGSILDREVIDWASDGDIVFSNTHCFDPEMMMALSALAAGMKPGTFFICTTYKLDETISGGFRVVKEFQAEMSWGVACGYILQKPAL